MVFCPDESFLLVFNRSPGAAVCGGIFLQLVVYPFYPVLAGCAFRLIAKSFGVLGLRGLCPPGPIQEGESVVGYPRLFVTTAVWFESVLGCLERCLREISLRLCRSLAWCGVGE